MPVLNTNSAVKLTAEIKYLNELELKPLAEISMNIIMKATKKIQVYRLTH